ncbi:MAG: phage holin family protein [Candidatus Obscuribacterales bacterium]|nr:phage holin family protein [Candidatus Obscuribacterales bacterium]
MARFLIRVLMVAYALAFLIPTVAGLSFKGDWLAAFSSSLVFTTVFTAIEWLLGVLVFGINVSTLGIGVIITTGLKFLVSLLAPSAALYGTAKLMPQFIGLSDLTPSLLAGGLLLGSLLFATSSSKGKK